MARVVRLRRCAECQRHRERVAFLEGRLARALALFGLDRLARELGISDDVIRRVFRSELTPSEAVLQADTVATLTDLARAGREDEFRWLARSQGARAEELDALWTGTVARARRRRRGKGGRA